MVLDNVDPLQTGRLMVQVPDVSDVLPSTWAMPCLPFAGIQSGFYAVPADRLHASGSSSSRATRTTRSGPAASGDQPPRFPRWRWPRRPGVQQVVVQTVSQNMLMVSDVPGPTGGILLKSSSGAMISVSDAGITSTTARARPSP